MAVRTFPFPAHLFRWWLVAPAAFGALVTGLATVFLRRTREPSLPRMSDEWLQNLDRETREPDSWR